MINKDFKKAVLYGGGQRLVSCIAEARSG